MMFRRVNKQPEYKRVEIYAVTIKISMNEYHHWINSLVHCLFYHYSLWGKWVWYFWSLVAYFCFFAALNNTFEVHFFQGFICYTISDTCNSCRAKQLRFFKVETLLNNAFNKWTLTLSCLLPASSLQATYLWVTFILKVVSHQYRLTVEAVHGELENYEVHRLLTKPLTIDLCCLNRHAAKG